MENTPSSDRKPLINELTQGRDLVKQLKVHLGRSASTTDLLITKILSSFDKAISMVDISKKVDQPDDHLIKGSTAATKETRTSSVICGSPQSHCNPEDGQIIRVGYKKRKRLPKWTEKVRVCLENGSVGPPDDGYDWRKYGQKDILGAKYPRSYYRCSSSKIQGCVAIKQVQRSNEEPSIFSITYEGRHTCIQISDLTADQQLVANNQYQNDQNRDLIREQKKQKRSQEIVLNFQTGSQVQTKEPGEAHELITTSCFSLFPSTSSISRFENENHIFSSSTLDNDYNIMDSSSPPYMSPIESESSFSSASNLQILDLVFSQDPADFQAHFLLDTPRIFN